MPLAAMLIGGTVVWFAVRPEQPNTRTVPASDAMAARSTPEPAPPASAAAPPLLSREVPESVVTGSPAAPPPSSPDAVASLSAPKPQEPLTAERGGGAERAAGAFAPAQTEAAAGENRAGAREEAAKAAAVVAAAPAPPPAAAPAAPVRPPAMAESDVAAVARRQQRAGRQTVETPADAAAPPAVVTAAPGAEAKEVESASGAALADARRDAASALAPTATFAEPEGRLRWRIVRAATIESSSDGGTTWTTRHQARGVRLVAGSAPAIETASVVGSRGTVLRLAVPGGWVRVAAPTERTLAAVAAQDALQARVTDDNGVQYETRDGGATWQQVSPP
jgi:hypothetical protein